MWLNCGLELFTRKWLKPELLIANNLKLGIGFCLKYCQMAVGNPNEL